MEHIPPGVFEDATVRILTSFVAEDGSHIHASELWRVMDWHEPSSSYNAYEIDGASGMLTLTDAELAANAQILHYGLPSD
jgi:hypothetical protein